jgi:hypothetical protein
MTLDLVSAEDARGVLDGVKAQVFSLRCGAYLA